VEKEFSVKQSKSSILYSKTVLHSPEKPFNVLLYTYDSFNFPLLDVESDVVREKQ
jgi:hypothetical protein